MTEAGFREGGFALVTALWAALILALVSSYLISAGRTDSRVERTLLRQAKQHALAEGIVNLIELRLSSPNSSGLPLDGSPFMVGYEGAAAEIRIQDQAGLVDLNFAPATILNRLLTVAGKLDAMTAQALVDRILDWRDKGVGRRLNGAKASDYADAGFAYGPRQGPFETLGELRLVMGMTPTIYARIAQCLTVYAQTPNVNLQVAPTSVLEIMPGVDAARISDIMPQRMRRNGDQSAVPAPETSSTRAVEISLSLNGTIERTVVRIGDSLNNLVDVYLPIE